MNYTLTNNFQYWSLLIQTISLGEIKGKNDKLLIKYFIYKLITIGFILQGTCIAKIMKWSTHENMYKYSINQ
jgi:hypothetical protein